MLHTSNNTDGNKLVIFYSIASYYGDNYILQVKRTRGKFMSVPRAHIVIKRSSLNCARYLGACTCSLCGVCVQWAGGRGSGEGGCSCGCEGGGWRGRGGKSPLDVGQGKTLPELHNGHQVLEASLDDPECSYGIALAVRR